MLILLLYTSRLREVEAKGRKGEGEKDREGQKATKRGGEEVKRRKDSDMRRAVNSVTNIIAEGFGRYEKLGLKPDEPRRAHKHL